MLHLKNNYNHFTQKFENFMQHIDTMSCQTNILGDFNMKSITKQEGNYIYKFEDHMKRSYNMTQYIQEPTHNNKSVLDLCFSTTESEYIFNMEPLVRPLNIGCYYKNVNKCILNMYETEIW